MARAKRQRRSTDPFLRGCSACDAGVGQPCNNVGKDGKPLATRATRLVHAVRLETERSTDA